MGVHFVCCSIKNVIFCLNNSVTFSLFLPPTVQVQNNLFSKARRLVCFRFYKSKTIKHYNMDIGQRIFDILKIILSGFALLATFYMVIDFTYFLSIPNEKVKLQEVSQGNLFNFVKIKCTCLSFLDAWVNISWNLLVDMFLLSLFVLQHSLLASTKIKEAFNTYGLGVIYRNLYVITTSGILLV